MAPYFFPLFSAFICYWLIYWCSLLWWFWTSGRRLIDVGNCETFLLRYINISISSSGKKLLKMWFGNVSNALLHFLFSVNNTLSLCQRVQIYLGPTFVERPNKIFKTKLCLTECTPKRFWTKKTTLESWSNNKNPFKQMEVGLPITSMPSLVHIMISLSAELFFQLRRVPLKMGTK